MSDDHAHGPGHEHSHEHTHAHSHGHDHSHEHSHDHAHEHEHSHEHTHSHSHEHTHEGDHAHERAPGGGDLAKLTALLKYMLDHNREHAAELEDVAHNLSHAGRRESADLIGEAVKDFGRANDRLARALDLLKDEK
jgi:hypothetical protein